MGGGAIWNRRRGWVGDGRSPSVLRVNKRRRYESVGDGRSPSVLRVNKERACWFAGRFALDDVGDDDVFGRVGPAAVVGDAGVDAGGGNDGGRSWSDVASLFDEELEGEAEIAAADFVESESVSVAVDSGPGDVVFVEVGIGVVIGSAVDEIEDGIGAVPVDVEVLDEFAVGVTPDLAFAGVAGESGASAEEFRGGAEILFCVFGDGRAATGEFF